MCVFLSLSLPLQLKKHSSNIYVRTNRRPYWIWLWTLFLLNTIINYIRSLFAICRNMKFNIEEKKHEFQIDFTILFEWKNKTDEKLLNVAKKILLFWKIKMCVCWIAFFLYKNRPTNGGKYTVCYFPYTNISHLLVTFWRGASYDVVLSVSHLLATDCSRSG